MWKRRKIETIIQIFILSLVCIELKMTWKFSSKIELVLTSTRVGNVYQTIRNDAYKALLKQFSTLDDT